MIQWNGLECVSGLWLPVIQRYRQGESGQEVIDELRAEYKRKQDDRVGWNIAVKEVELPEEDEE